MNVVFLHHPNSAKTFRLKDFRSRRVNITHLNCGFTNGYKNGYRESDFFPGYASFNSILFETSCILTMWEHADQLFQDGPVMILHTDITPMVRVADLLDYLEGLKTDYVAGLTVPSYHADEYEDMLIPDTNKYRASVDPWRSQNFDGIVDIWELVRMIDPDAWEFAQDTDPIMIYSHQFVASRPLFDELGYHLCQTVTQLKLGQCGLWTPHVFERILAIRLAMLARPRLLAAFSHQSSSGPKGEGALTLYGPRAYKYLRLKSRVMEHGYDGR